jgi:hypothetical protein
MRLELALPSTLVVAVVVLPLTPAGSWAAGKVPLECCSIVSDPDQPSYVQYGVEELAGYLSQLTGSKVPVGAPPDGGPRVRIVIGPQPAQRVLTQPMPLRELGEEGYLIQYVNQGGVEHIVATGATPRGTKAAIAALRCSTPEKGGHRASQLLDGERVPSYW